MGPPPPGPMWMPWTITTPEWERERGPSSYELYYAPLVGNRPGSTSSALTPDYSTTTPDYSPMMFRGKWTNSRQYVVNGRVIRSPRIVPYTSVSDLNRYNPY